VNLGIPDCLIALKDQGKFVMVELKVVKKGLKVNLSPHQVAFHIKHAELGCPSFVLVEYHPPNASRVNSFLQLYEGSQAGDLLARGVLLTPIDKWSLANVDWQVLREKLTQ
jgi:hypothetical protein